jgi:predicted nucleic acid-binding protein
MAGPQIVLDTNVLVAAFRSRRGSSFRLLSLVDAGRFEMNQFIATAVAEKLASLATMEYLEQRAQTGSRDKFNAVLAKVPDVEPQEGDEL